MGFLSHAARHPVAESVDFSAAKALGFVSLCIGLTELLAPKKIEKMVGVSNGQNTGVLRVLGVRELMHGVDLLFHADPAQGLLARVAGDVLDTAVIGMFARKTRNPSGLATVFALVLPVVIADVIFGGRVAKRRV